MLKGKAEVLEACAKICGQITALRHEMTNYFADDLSTGEHILDKEIRNQYVQRVYKIRDLEKSAADLLVKL